LIPLMNAVVRPSTASTTSSSVVAVHSATSPNGLQIETLAHRTNSVARRCNKWLDHSGRCQNSAHVEAAVRRLSRTGKRSSAARHFGVEIDERDCYPDSRPSAFDGIAIAENA
jgi:hypothetical protein